MEIRKLELFLAVLESSSVTRAAEKVHLSPGAVSVQMQALARELRTELFTRSGRRFVATPAALRLAEPARAVLRQVRQIEQEFEGDPALDVRPFRFATGATTLIYCLARPLRLLRGRYPRTEIQVTVAPTEQMVAGLFDRRFDLALISLPYPEEGLKIIPLYEERTPGLAALPEVCPRIQGRHHPRFRTGPRSLSALSQDQQHACHHGRVFPGPRAEPSGGHGS